MSESPSHLLPRRPSITADSPSKAVDAGFRRNDQQRRHHGSGLYNQRKAMLMFDEKSSEGNFRTALRDALGATRNKTSLLKNRVFPFSILVLKFEWSRAYALAKPISDLLHSRGTCFYESNRWAAAALFKMRQREGHLRDVRMSFAGPA